jgi:hypothetical protein
MAVKRDIDPQTLGEGVPTAGDDVELTFEIPDIPTGQSLTKAWFSVKRILPEPDPGLVQKIVTTTDVPGTGRITDDGAGDTEGAVRIDLSPADSALLTGRYNYGVKVKTSAGRVYTAVQGCIQFNQPTTHATE